jgi:methylthioribose-1-phosphate isomerase
VSDAKYGILQPHSHIPALSLKRKLIAAQRNLASSRDTFANLDETVPEDIHNTWMAQERNALVERLSNAKAMDIFEVQLEKGRSYGNKYRKRLK